MIYGRVVERVIISRENLEEIFDVRRRFVSRKAGIGYVSPFRNLGVWLWFWKPVDTPNDRKISRVSFFLSKIFRFLGISRNREKPWESRRSGEKMTALFKDTFKRS